MRHRAPPPAFDELLARVRDLPEGHRGQIFDGEIHITEPPSSARAHTLAEISAMLVAGSPLGDPVPEGWTFLAGAELAAGPERLLVADVAGWTLPKDAPALTSSPVRAAPAWVCEVLGGSTRAFTLTAKRRVYAEMGVAHLWIADPEAEVIEVFQNTRGKWLLHACFSEERGVAALPFEALHFDAGDLFLPGQRQLGTRRGAVVEAPVRTLTVPAGSPRIAYESGGTRAARHVLGSRRWLRLNVSATPAPNRDPS